MADRDAILEQLEQRHQPSLIIPPEPDDGDILDIEEAILLPIRGDFRDFLLTASDKVIGSLEPATVADPQAHNYLPEIASQAWEQGVEREYLAFCIAAEGYYCLTIDDQVILIAPQDDAPSRGEWDSIWNWAEDVWLKS